MDCLLRSATEEFTVTVKNAQGETIHTLTREAGCEAFDVGVLVNVIAGKIKGWEVSSGVVFLRL